MKLTKNQLLFITIFIEGYAVLATELLAIRIVIPYIDNSPETISVIIGFVLISLAVGYHVGGKRKVIRSRTGKIISIRERLLNNILNTLAILAFGLSIVLLEGLFNVMQVLNVPRLVQATIYSGIFLSYPVFLLGQTIPLISNYFSQKSISSLTGRMLFFSTLGSFAGSIFSTVVLMAVIGVHNTVIFTIFLLLSLVILLARKVYDVRVFVALFLFMLSVLMNNDGVMKEMKIISNNKYNTIAVFSDPQEKGARIFSVNSGMSSKYSKDREKMYDYWKYIDKNFIKYARENKKPLSILVIGAGGFTMGLDDDISHYTFIDIDPDLKNIAEEHFLKKNLGKNKKFVVEPGRAFLNRNKEKFDLVIVDAYLNPRIIPFQLITEEFFQQAKNAVAENGNLLMNVISRPDFTDAFAVKFDYTFRKVFNVYSRVPVQKYNPFSSKKEDRNVIYIWNNNKFTNTITSEEIYTDDKNTFYHDR